MEPLYTMSPKELIRLDAIAALASGQLKQREVALRLGLSLRQLKRLVRAYRQCGPAGLLSRRRGQPSNRRTDPRLLAAAIARVRERYNDFGPTLACEKLAELDGIIIKRERLRQALIEAGIWKPKRKRRAMLHPPRERRPQSGELVQGDGSPHDWFEGRGPRCSLVLFVDDATSAIGAALFTPRESTEAYFALIKTYIEQHGKPIALYVDKFSVFKATNPGKNDDRTQFSRAMEELGIEIICANSPQAKGRVERANRTLQDRLVKELRLHAIDAIEQANRFLPAFIAAHNKRFAVPPRCNINAHRQLPQSERLDVIRTHVEERTISKDLTLKYRATLYRIIAPDQERRLKYQRVLVREQHNSISLEYQGQQLAFEAVILQVRNVAGAKDINAFVDRTRLGPRTPDPKKQRDLPRKHPWKVFRPKPPAATS